MDLSDAPGLQPKPKSKNQKRNENKKKKAAGADDDDDDDDESPSKPAPPPAAAAKPADTAANADPKEALAKKVRRPIASCSHTNIPRPYSGREGKGLKEGFT
jgi:hypothetical protein